MTHLEEIYVADAKQSVLNTTLDDGVEEGGYDVINLIDQYDEGGSRIKSTGSSISSRTSWIVNDILVNAPISCQAGFFFLMSFFSVT